MPDRLPAPLRIEIPTDLAFVRPVRKMLEGLLYAQGWVQDDVDDASLIITEIVQNAVEHGSRGDGRESVQISIEACEQAVEMIVEDPGTGDDPHAAVARDVLTPAPLEAARGRGLFLIHRLAGRFERSVGPSGGFCLKARKEITP